MDKTKRNSVVLVVVFVVLVALFAGLYFGLKERGTEGEKTITVTVVTGQGEKTPFTIKTKEEFLLGALNQIELIKTEDSVYGAFVVEVNGVKAESENREFWEIIKNDEPTMTGVSDTPVSDGDRFELRLSTY